MAEVQSRTFDRIHDQREIYQKVHGIIRENHYPTFITRKFFEFCIDGPLGPYQPRDKNLKLLISKAIQDFKGSRGGRKFRYERDTSTKRKNPRWILVIK
jgi:hypothetical protein